jgi:hypothetical protein
MFISLYLRKNANQTSRLVPQPFLSRLLVSEQRANRQNQNKPTNRREIDSFVFSIVSINKSLINPRTEPTMKTVTQKIMFL